MGHLKKAAACLLWISLVNALPTTNVPYSPDLTFNVTSLLGTKNPTLGTIFPPGNFWVKPDWDRATPSNIDENSLGKLTLMVIAQLAKEPWTETKRFEPFTSPDEAPGVGILMSDESRDIEVQYQTWALLECYKLIAPQYLPKIQPCKFGFMTPNVDGTYSYRWIGAVQFVSTNTSVSAVANVASQNQTNVAESGSPSMTSRSLAARSNKNHSTTQGIQHDSSLSRNSPAVTITDLIFDDAATEYKFGILDAVLAFGSSMIALARAPERLNHPLETKNLWSYPTRGGGVTDRDIFLALID